MGTSIAVPTVKPVNGFVAFFEHVGHDVEVVFGCGERLVADLPKYIKTAEDAQADAVKVVPLVQNVIATSLAFAKPAIAIGAAVSGAGANFIADEAAIAAVLAIVPTLQGLLAAFVAAVKALASAIGVDWSQLIADLSGSALSTATAQAAA